MTAGAKRREGPVIWAVVCTDVDGKRYVFEMANRRSGARAAMRVWRKNERCKRRYEVVRYVPAPSKMRRRHV